MRTIYWEVSYKEKSNYLTFTQNIIDFMGHGAHSKGLGRFITDSTIVDVLRAKTKFGHEIESFDEHHFIFNTMNQLKSTLQENDVHFFKVVTYKNEELIFRDKQDFYKNVEPRLHFLYPKEKEMTSQESINKVQSLEELAKLNEIENQKKSKLINVGTLNNNEFMHRLKSFNLIPIEDILPF